jgi:hypothetical protein
MREFAGAIIQVAQIEVGCYILGIARYRQVVRAASLVELSARQQNVAAVQVCWRALRVRLDRSIIAGHCLSDAPLFLERISFMDHRDCEVTRCGWRDLEICHLLSFADLSRPTAAAYEQLLIIV